MNSQLMVLRPTQTHMDNTKLFINPSCESLCHRPYSNVIGTEYSPQLGIIHHVSHKKRHYMIS